MHTITTTVFVPENRENQWCVLEIQIASQKFQTLSFMKTTTMNTAFLIDPGSCRSFCAWTYRSHFWLCCTGTKDRNMQICSRKCSAHAQKTPSRRSFSKVSGREHPIRAAASWIDLQNQGTICKNVLCTRESMVESIDSAPAKPSPVKMKRFQASSHSRALSANKRSQLCRISNDGAQCRLPRDFPIKSGSQIYFINVGIRLLICSRKLCCVLDFGDFCSWKRNFGVGMYVICTAFCLW